LQSLCDIIAFLFYKFPLHVLIFSDDLCVIHLILCDTTASTSFIARVIVCLVYLTGVPWQAQLSNCLWLPFKSLVKVDWGETHSHQEVFEGEYEKVHDVTEMYVGHVLIGEDSPSFYIVNILSKKGKAWLKTAQKKEKCRPQYY
jgi:hypothetical protein